MEDEFEERGKEGLDVILWVDKLEKARFLSIFLLPCHVRVLSHFIYILLLTSCVQTSYTCYTLSQLVCSNLGLDFMYHAAMLALNNIKPGLYSSVSTSSHCATSGSLSLRLGVPGARIGYILFPSWFFSIVLHFLSLHSWRFAGGVSTQDAHSVREVMLAYLCAAWPRFPLSLILFLYSSIYS